MQCNANETLLATALLLLVATATRSLSPTTTASSSSCFLTASRRVVFDRRGPLSGRRHDLVAFPTALLLLGLEERVAHRGALPFRDPAVFGGWRCGGVDDGGQVILGAIRSHRGEPFATGTTARPRSGSRPAGRRSSLSGLPTAADGRGRGRSRSRWQHERERSRFEFVNRRDGARTRHRAGGGEVGERRGYGGEKVELGGAGREVRFEVG